MDTEYTAFMRDLETRFREATQLPDRSYYKIFYGQIRPAEILTLGINPGGAPENTHSDGRTHKDGKVAAASASCFENDEHDVLDCNFRENYGLLKLLKPLLDGDVERIRRDVVKTNIAFHRSAKKKDINIHSATKASAPFLNEIIKVVQPKLVLLTGVNLSTFNDFFTSDWKQIEPPEKNPKVKHVVFAASCSRLSQTGMNTPVIQVAHASQFSWTYEDHRVVERIQAIINSGICN